MGRFRSFVTTPRPLRWWLWLVAGGLVVVFTGSVVAGAVGISNLTAARGELVDRAQPAVNQALRLTKALVDQETGLRGYVVTAQDMFLEPYRAGYVGQQQNTTRLRELLAADPVGLADFEQVITLAERWRTGYAEPFISRVQAAGPSVSEQDLADGKARFDSIRVALNTLQSNLDNARDRARTSLSDAAAWLVTTCVVIAALLLTVFVMAALALRAAMVGPLSQLTYEVGQVVQGNFEHDVRVRGPRELVQLGEDVDSMRRRIVSALDEQERVNAELDASAANLKRSNAELEQFAYVASHDLQEPLRKVASFCDLLRRRYEGQLDERADQYIFFAVDGAKRMQRLINDLLAFSRVGRRVGKQQRLNAADLAEQAQANLAEAIADSDARIEVGPLPQVTGEQVLLTAVFQNLISNAVKFRAGEPPRVEIIAETRHDHYLFTVTDNGIGVEPEFADRIFVIFQRLHNKTEYPGTGIGLAMCRKIIEYHGGRIWLDTSHHPGSRFRFTLPLFPDTTTVVTTGVLDGDSPAATGAT